MSRNDLKINRVLSFLIMFILISYSCKKEELKREVKIITNEISEITAISAKVAGEIIDIGEGVEDHGHCWGRSSTPTILENKTSFGTTDKTGKFYSSLTNLEIAKNYFIRAYAICSSNVIYGDELTFTTKDGIVRITTANVTEIKTNSALCGGMINDDGGMVIDRRGVCWSTSENPTIILSTKTIDGSGSGFFASAITGLDDGITYNIRAYATNSKGTTYGNNISFTTLQLPTVITIEPTNVGTLIATLNGEINASNSSTTVTFEYGTTMDYGLIVTADQSPVTGNISTRVSANVSGLSESTTYHFRVKASSSVGTVYGDDISFTTLASNGDMTDIDGNTYGTIIIGSQVWMTANLKTTKYNDGGHIQNLTDNIEWYSTSLGAFCWYDNSLTNKDEYGGLYNWYSVNTGKLCPIGWHVPSDEEWNLLINYLGGIEFAGGKLKEVGTDHWFTQHLGTDNSSGFTAVGGGARSYSDGSFVSLKNFGNWWSATEYDINSSWKFGLGASYVSVFRLNSKKNNGNSIRCIKD